MWNVKIFTSPGSLWCCLSTQGCYFELFCHQKSLKPPLMYMYTRPRHIIKTSSNVHAVSIWYYTVDIRTSWHNITFILGVRQYIPPSRVSLFHINFKLFQLKQCSGYWLVILLRFPRRSLANMLVRGYRSMLRASAEVGLVIYHNCFLIILFRLPHQIYIDILIVSFVLKTPLHCLTPSI